MRTTIQAATTELRDAWRGYIRPALVLVLLLGVVVFGQEPPTFRRSGMDFAWQSLHPLILLVCAGLPLARALRAPATRDAWDRRLARTRLGLEAGGTAGVAAAILFLGGAATGGLFALDRITTGEMRLGAVRSMSLQVLLVAPPLSTLPPLLSIGWSAATRVGIWLILLILGFGSLGIAVGIPLDSILTLTTVGDAVEPRLLLSIGLVTLAGLATRMAVAPVRNGRTCESASSATSTATSKH